MADFYFSEMEGVGSAPGLPSPSPSETPYHTPRVSVSRRSSRRGTSSRAGSSSPPPLPSSSPGPIPSDGFLPGPGGSANDSHLDPRRFTPTLHANLVSEILSLRRDIDSKHQTIEDLETRLSGTKDDNVTLNQKLSEHDRERRALKRQFSQLENGTLAALEELAKERDQFKAANAELKDKFELSQKKIRALEEDSTRTHEQWGKEKDSWGGEKRQMERKVHLTESRLKLVLDELAAQQEAAHIDEHHGESEDEARDSGVGNESDTTSVRSLSRASPKRRNRRHSRTMSSSSHLSLAKIYRQSGTNGVSLADELEFDEEDEDFMEILGEDEEDFPENEARLRRALSQQSIYHDEKAKRVLGLTTDNRTPNLSMDLDPRNRSDNESFLSEKPSFMSDRPSFISERLSYMTEKSPAKMAELKRDYVDTGVQFSPPPSPTLAPIAAPDKKLQDLIPAINDVEANQRKKRVSTASVDRVATPVPAQVQKSTMVSSGSQTMDKPLSPPATPVVSPPSSPQMPSSIPLSSEYSSMSTQTDAPEEPTARPVTPPPTTTTATTTTTTTTNKRTMPPIPVIAVHPPLSAPPSPGLPILPPGTKNAGCQTSFPADVLVESRSISVQTEGIRIDERHSKLPAHLLPSSISSSPPTPEPGARPRKERPAKMGPYNSKSVLKRPESPFNDDIPSSPPTMPPMMPPAMPPMRTVNKYPGSNDSGPFARDDSKNSKRPFRNSSLFASFEEPDLEEEDEDEELPTIDSDDEFVKAPTITASLIGGRVVKMKHGRKTPNPPTPVPEDREVVSRPRGKENRSPTRKSFGTDRSPTRKYSNANRSGRSSPEKPSRVTKTLRSGGLMRQPSIGLARQPSIRRSALIQSGAAAHMRSRSPSLGSVASSKTSGITAPPPFPVPDRRSSRKLFPQSKSEGHQSPTPKASTGNGFMGRKHARQLSRKESLRKVRSAAVIPRRGGPEVRPRSRSPPMTPQGYPPLPKDAVTPGQKKFNSQRDGVRPQPTTTGNASTEAPPQSTVVDAIAAAMVGEWMFKYVRRRKSFGVPETAQDFGKTADDGSMNVTGNGVRHKRWVWLSPYERAVMWSSKQPTSGTALMGKSGRKLIIQSVLDVKDDTPLPKNSGVSQPFNRSILILTPARALKFTATSRERHYIWLTALSFLAHSPLSSPELGPPLPPIPQIPEEPPQSRGGSLRRGPIRDSVRLAKDKRPAFLASDPIKSPTIHEYAGTVVDYPIPDAASPPNVPRERNTHGRKRSTTGPRIPAPAANFRTFSQPQVPSHYMGSSEYGGASIPSSVYGGTSIGGPSLVASGRTSEASSSAAQKNFFEAVGTVRMEAFVEPRFSEESGPLRGRVGARRRGNTNWSGTGSDPRRSGVFFGDEFDPFKGF